MKSLFRGGSKGRWLREKTSPSLAKVGVILLVLFGAPMASSACGGTEPAGDQGSAGGGAAASGSSVVSSTAIVSSASSTGSGGGSGGMSPAPPTPEQLGFKPLNSLPTGERIVFNDWAAPDKVKAMAPDGSDVVDVFEIFRVWAMGVSNDRTRIAFSCGDPNQVDNFGLTFSDSIQHTWMYDVNAESISVLASGNINDECHVFSPNDETLFVCRRYDFKPDGLFSGYRIASHALPGGAPVWVTEEKSQTFTLTPEPSVDGKTLWFTHVRLEGAKQIRSVRKLTLPDGEPELVLTEASRPVLSPDGKRLLFSNALDGGNLYASDLEGKGSVQISAARGTSAAFSPDGQKVAYLRWDDSAACSHIEVVASDGSNKGAPERIRDCALSKERITQLEWIK